MQWKNERLADLEGGTWTCSKSTKYGFAPSWIVNGPTVYTEYESSKRAWWWAKRLAEMWKGKAQRYNAAGKIVETFTCST